MIRIIVCICSLFWCHNVIWAQILVAKDTTTKEIISPPKKNAHSPKKAAIMSAILPGSGQIYNQNYWKPGLIWAGLGTITFFYISTNSEYQLAKESYLTLIDANATPIAYKGSTNLSKVTAQKNQLKNNRDLFLVLGVLWYGLNIIDATVDAHLFNFNISDDLSLRIEPSVKYVLNNSPSPFLDFTFQFKSKIKSNYITPKI